MATQDNRFVSVTTPLGEDILLFNRLSGTEELGRPFEYEVDLLMESSVGASMKNSGFPINNVLGQAMVVTLTSPTGNKRYFHGLVAQFKQHGTLDDFYLYRAVLRPWLWFLTRSSNCRIFQDKSVPDIITKIFKDYGFSDFKFQLDEQHRLLDYCVQYRETDFNFVSRLMENEGMFYFFRHSENSHLLIIADSINSFQAISGFETISYFPPENTELRKQEHIFEWHTDYEVQAGTYVLNDYDFKNPKSSLISKSTQQMPHSHANGEHYDYPGNYVDHGAGNAYSNIRLEELQAEYQVIEGKANVLGLATGILFTLKDYDFVPENTKHIVIAANFSIASNQYRSTSAEETHYECGFKAIRASEQFRPQRLTPVPFVQGLQTATVVGPSGEEVYTDKYGRIKVKFHWDRDEQMDQTSSCWVRVAHPIAGKNWGWISVPRIGQEVVVSFLEGNPDRPLITGSVYNQDQMPPYPLPDNQTKSGIKTRSSKAGGLENYNEIRFEDRKGEEELYVHAEKNFNCVIENNETRKIGLDKKNKGDQTTEIQNNRTTTLNQGNDKLTVAMGDYSVDISAGKATITAAVSIELKVGSNSVKIEQSGITINGVMVSVKAETKLDAKGTMTAVNGSAVLTLNGAVTKIN